MKKLVFKSGSLFTSKATILVNPVNTVGVMGAGLAKTFKNKYPENFEKYKEYCKEHNTVSRYHGFAHEENGQIIYNLATKEDWRGLSTLGYVRRGLFHLVNWLNNYPYRDNIKSIAIPPLGCGLGGLEQVKVLHLIIHFLREVKYDITIYAYGFKDVPTFVKSHMLRYNLAPRQNRRFAGVGSRETPASEEFRINALCRALLLRGYTLGTGDATGADEMFYNSYPPSRAERFAPFGKKNYKLNSIVVPPETVAYDIAEKLAAKYHPGWRWMKQQSHRELHIRNGYQLLGENLDNPVEFMICWTRDGTESKTGKKSGGTGQAIRLAEALGIQVFNLNTPDVVARLTKYLGTRRSLLSF